jgi:3-deoxy-manno-octulosonate cytidylyltransferase (CMP-KDO synthetase)
MPRVAVVIPARYASTRLPGKPLHPIAGKPLIQHVWERCARAKGIETVIVATDDMRIAEAAFGFGAEVAMTSPKHRSGTDRVAEVATNLRGFTHVINVQGDEPMVDPALVSKLAAAMAKDRRIEMITAASVFGPDEDLANPNVVKVVCDRAGDALYFSRSVIPFVRDGGENAQRSTLNAQPSALFLRHQGIYGYTTKFLLQFVKWKPGVLEQAESLEQLRALENGAKIRVILAKAAAVSVDTPEDVAVVERLLAAPSSSSSSASSSRRRRG